MYTLTPQTLERYKRTLKDYPAATKRKKELGCEYIYGNEKISVGKDSPEILEAIEHMEKQWLK